MYPAVVVRVLVDLSTPTQIMLRLENLEADLALAQNELSEAAKAWYPLLADRKVAVETGWAMSAGTVPERKAQAEAAGAVVGVEEEARWEALKLVVRVMETRANIGMGLLKAHSRA